MYNNPYNSGSPFERVDDIKAERDSLRIANNSLQTEYNSLYANYNQLLNQAQGM